MSVETDLGVIGPAAVEAAGVLADALGLGAQPGESFDLWGQPDGAGEVLAKGGKAWSAELLGPLGPCGQIALALAGGASVPGEGRVASALAGSTAPLAAAFGADHVGEMRREDPATLGEPRPNERAVAVPLLAGEKRIGLFVVVGSTQAAAELPHLDPAPGSSGGGSPRSIAALGEVTMNVSVELGRTKLAVKDLLELQNGAVVQLDRSVTHPVDILVQGTLIARGEVVVVDECFAVRVTELLTGD